jgi:hypothetical protein
MTSGGVVGGLGEYEKVQVTSSVSGRAAFRKELCKTYEIYKHIYIYIYICMSSQMKLYYDRRSVCLGVRHPYRTRGQFFVLS